VRVRAREEGAGSPPALSGPGVKVGAAEEVGPGAVDISDEGEFEAEADTAAELGAAAEVVGAVELPP
jgi:hypothetical protein